MSGRQAREPRSPVSFDVSVARLPQRGLPIVVEARQAQRAELASAHELLAVDKFRAELLVERWKRNGIRITGRVRAEIVQQCIVTLDPMQSTIDEEIDSVFLPEDSKLGRLGFEGGGEIVLSVEGPDSPETFTGDVIDVGALAEEFFGLAIDPYPRKAGAALDTGTAVEIDGPLQQKLRALRDRS